MPLKRGFTLTAKDERAAADAVLPGAARRLKQAVQGRVLIATRAAAVAAAAAFAVAVCLAVAQAVTIAVCIAVTIAAVRAIAVEIVAARAPASFASLAAPAAPAALALALPLPLFGALCFPAAAPRHLHAMREAIRCHQMQSDAFAFPRRLRGTCCPASSSNESLNTALVKLLECSTVGEIPPACNEGGN